MEVPGQDPVGQLGDLPRDLDARGPAADDDEREPCPSPVSGSCSIAAISNAPRIRARSSSASSIVFMPGAQRENSSCPKYDCPAPAATIRLSYGNLELDPVRAQRRQRSAIEVESRHARQRRPAVFRWRRSTLRIGGAIWPSDRIPVATWYSSGWNRWWLTRSTRVRSTGRALQEPGREQPPEPAADDDDAMPPADASALAASDSPAMAPSLVRRERRLRLSDEADRGRRLRCARDR